MTNRNHYPISVEVCGCWYRSEESTKVWHEFITDKNWDNLTLAEKEQIRREYNKFAHDNYAVPVMLLGPEEGAFYSSAYCITCLRELLEKLEEYERESHSDVG